MININYNLLQAFIAIRNRIDLPKFKIAPGIQSTFDPITLKRIIR